MSIFNEVSSGGVKTRGCALHALFHIIETAFAPGDVVFKLNKAKIGVLKKVVIKKSKVVNKGGQYLICYFDTLNAFWGENELVPYSVAIQYAEDYLESLQGQLDTAGLC